MEAKRSQKRWTYEEYAKLPESGSTRYEVIGGELYVTSAPTVTHQRVVAKLVLFLTPFAEAHRYGEVLPGPVDVLFGEGDYLQPDLVFVRADRANIVSKRGIEAAPDLVVEILSPSTSKRDRRLKLERYRHFGVAEYWIIDPSRRAIEVWRLAAGATTAEIRRAGERLEWIPVAGGPALELEVSDLIPTE